MARLGDKRLSEFYWQRISPDERGCWNWTGWVRKDGYAMANGKCGERRRDIRVHRATYGALIGPIPDGLHIDHLCRNRRCVNPDHLEPVTHAENHRRGLAGLNFLIATAMRTGCPKGHEYTSENTYLDKHGRRNCRQCRAAAKERFLQRKKEQAVGPQR